MGIVTSRIEKKTKIKLHDIIVIFNDYFIHNNLYIKT